MKTQYFKAFILTLLVPIALFPSKKGREFVTSHRLPQEVIERADSIFSNKQVYKALRRCKKQALQAAGIKPIQTSDNVIMEHDELPGYVIKFGNRFGGLFSTIGRIRLAEKIERYVKREGITTVHVPKKYLYHIPGRGKSLRDQNYLVFSQKMQVQDKTKPRLLTQRAIRDTCKVIRRFAIVDASPGNMSLLDNNNVAILDTEPTIRTGGGMWYLLDNPLTRLVQGTIGTFLFRRSVSES